jgi:hypothetical protein
MLLALRLCLLILGASAIAIAASILVTGAEATAALAEGVFDTVSGWRGGLSEHWPPTMDSELRFYAALWGAYGVVLIRAAIGLPGTLPQAPWLAAVFFAGGVGRLISRVSFGAPHPVFTLLMIIELALPVLMALLWFGARAEAKRVE